MGGRCHADARWLSPRLVQAAQMKRKKVAVIGCGFVGRGMLRLFQNSPFELAVRDKDRQAERDTGYSCDTRGADLALICVPTPMLPDGRADTSIVEEVVAAVDADLICIKSTVPPGMTDRLAARYNKDVH